MILGNVHFILKYDTLHNDSTYYLQYFFFQTIEFIIFIFLGCMNYMPLQILS